MSGSRAPASGAQPHRRAWSPGLRPCPTCRERPTTPFPWAPAGRTPGPDGLWPAVWGRGQGVTRGAPASPHSPLAKPTCRAQAPVSPAAAASGPSPLGEGPGWVTATSCPSCREGGAELKASGPRGVRRTRAPAFAALSGRGQPRPPASERIPAQKDTHTADRVLSLGVIGAPLGLSKADSPSAAASGERRSAPRYTAQQKRCERPSVTQKPPGAVSLVPCWGPWDGAERVPTGGPDGCGRGPSLPREVTSSRFRTGLRETVEAPWVAEAPTAVPRRGVSQVW